MTSHFRTYAYPVTGGITLRNLPDRQADVVHTKDFGAIADGASHPLSDRYGSLGAAQVDYPFATALTQEIDYCACKAASNAAFGGDLEVIIDYALVSQASDDTHIIDSSQNWTVNQYAGFTAFRKFTSNGFVTSVPILSNTATELTLAAPMPDGSITDINEYAIGYGEHGGNAVLNRPLHINRGTYVFGDDTWTIRNLASARIYGDGNRVSVLTGNNTVLAFDGLWYTTIAHLSFSSQTSDPAAVLDIDGNVPGHDYDTRGVQGVNLIDVSVDAAGGDYALALCRQGGSSAQGSECVYLDVHLSGASSACYYQAGFNALSNIFLGGDMQSYTKHGAWINGGTAGFLHTSFESNNGYTQYVNGGWDIIIGDSGAFQAAIIHGCRTESMRFLHNGGATLTDVRGCIGRVNMPTWFAGVVKAVGDALFVEASAAVFVVTAVTSDNKTGSVEPTWPTDGSPVTDHNVTWQETPFNFIEAVQGSVDVQTCFGQAGAVVAPPATRATRVTADYTAQIFDDIIIVDATAGAVTVTIPTPASTPQRGRTITIKKTDASANAVTLSAAAGFDESGTTATIPGGARGYRTYVYADGTGGTRRWQEIASS